MKRYRPIDGYVIEALPEPNLKRDYVKYKDVVRAIKIAYEEYSPFDTTDKEIEEWLEEI